MTDVVSAAERPRAGVDTGRVTLAVAAAVVVAIAVPVVGRRGVGTPVAPPVTVAA